MRIEMITINLYSIDELSDKAQECAFEKWRNEIEYPYSDENKAVLATFCDIFNIKVSDWRCNECDYSFTYQNNSQMDFRAFTGVRLCTYLLNNFYDSLFVPKMYYASTGRKRRTSRIFVHTDCILTGYYLDNEILQPIYDFIKEPKDDCDFDGLMKLCLNSFFRACKNDMKNYFAFENFIGECNSNDYEFTEDGKRY